MKFSEIVKSLDWVLVGTTALLVGVSLAMLFSSSAADNISSSLFLRQSIAAAVSILTALFIVRTPYHTFQRYTIALYVLGLTSLCSLLFVGRIIRGTTSRLEVGGFQIQPSEFMKIALILMLAWVFSRRGNIGWRGSITSALLTFIPTILIIFEPDLGVSVIFLLIWYLMLIFSGASWRMLAAYVSAGILVAIFSWFFFLADYQKDRIRVFLDPSADPQGVGYNVVQSVIALGSGHIWGRGLGHGPQSQLQFLPERHTDFILASLGEELGFLGILVVLTLYAIMLWRILKIAQATLDPFGQLVTVGVFMLLSISLFITGGMNMGLLPVTGLPLPLLSYGGSNLLSTIMLLAIVQSIHVHSRWLRQPPAEISYFT